ncbi:LpxI family protein [Salinarimonas rosea]|uniref:LpxI family protein n=1 Tax=Salinarimonas rosea TaxID=552063 RepID=UPI00041117F5|nr:UDP-2,3-diacylglucosamine diphosphatase LpxI [Salinarimonas rosea]
MDGEGPVVVVAGAGALPALLIGALDAAARPRRVIALKGFADAATGRRADRTMSLLDVSGILAQLAAWRPAAVTLAGGVTRPSPAALASGVAAWRNRRELAELFARGDDHLLRGVVALLEEQGHRVVGAHEIAPDLLAPAGVLGTVHPDAEARRAIETGFSCLAALSPFDVGQACVAVAARVVAVEGAEGTDRMLARVGGGAAGRLAGLLPALRRATPAAGVLVKSAKAGQDHRVDLAASGPRTVRNAARAGLAGIALGAGATLTIERDAMIAEADRAGLFLVGVDPGAARPGEVPA